MTQTQTEEYFTKQEVWTPKNVNHERQRNTKEQFQIKGVQREMATKCNVWSWIGSWVRKNGIKDITSPTHYILDNNVFSMLNFLNLIIVLGLCKRISLFVGDTY